MRDNPRAGSLPGRPGLQLAGAEGPGRSLRELASQVVFELTRFDSLLLEGIAIAHGDRGVGERLAIHCDAEGSPDLVLPPVSPSNGAAVVVEDRECLAQIVRDSARHLRHPVLLHQREYTSLDRSDRRVKPE